MAAEPQSSAIARIEATLGAVKDEARAHYGEDDVRFTDLRREREDTTRRLYERIEAMARESRADFIKAIAESEQRTSLRLAEVGTAVNKAVESLLNKTGDLERARHNADLARVHAEGVAEGIEKAKTPSKTRAAIIQGVSGQLAGIIVAAIAAVAVATFELWMHDHTSSTVTVEHTSHGRQ